MSTPPPSGDAPGPRERRLFEVLSALQARRPFAVLAVALFTALLAGVAASRLTLKTSLAELLPTGKESVAVAEKVKERLVSSSTLFIVAESKDTEALKRFVDALAPELRALPPGQLGAVDDGVRDAAAFYEKHALLYAPLEDVREVHAHVLERYEREVAKAAGFDLGLDDEPAEPAGAGAGAGATTTELLRQKLDAKRRDALESKYPGGYYLSPEKDLIVIATRTPVGAGDVDKAGALLATVRAAIDRVGPARFAPDMVVTFTGGLITSSEEYQQIKGDLTEVGLVGVAMILGVVFLYYLRLRPIIAMTLSVGVGVLWTFGLAWALIGYLNSSTGFLFSIIAGNGINFGIIYMARYFEARAARGPGDLEGSLLAAHVDTWRATLAGAGAASVAYGSLVVTEFRGFKHFGVIGGGGMFLCWAATYLFLPAILAVFERTAGTGSRVVDARAPRLAATLEALGRRVDRLRGGYGRPFAYLVDRFPRAVAILGVLTGLAAFGLTVRYIAADPMEYDMSNTRTVPKTGPTPARRLLGRVDKIVGRGQDGLAILVDRIEQVRPLRAALEARRAAAPEKQKPFERVADIYDLLPKDQEQKIPLIEEARDRLQRARKRGLVSDTDWAELGKYMPAGELRPLGIDDLPEQVARMFVEKDGTRGRLVYIVPTVGRSVWDGRYLLEWADSFRSTALPDGSVVKGSGNAVIFADLIIAVIEDAPKAIALSIAGTLLIIVITFRARALALVAIATLALGLSWMMAALALYGAKLGWTPGGMPTVQLTGLKLNFLNFITLPIAVGMGADYAINVLQRREVMGAGTPVREVILTAGGAVILCSLTTTLGYLGLTFSINKATVSFGYSAAAAELACLSAAVLVLPAFITWRERRSRRAPPSGTTAG